MVLASVSHDMNHLCTDYLIRVCETSYHIYTELHVCTLTGKFIRESVLVAVIFLFGICIADWMVRTHFINDLAGE